MVVVATWSTRWSDPQLRMRPEANELEDVVVRQPIDQHKVRLDVAVPMVLPVAFHGMVSVSRFQWLATSDGVQHLGEGIVQGLPMLPRRSRL